MKPYAVKRRTSIKRLAAVGVTAGFHTDGELNAADRTVGPNDEIRIGVIGSGNRARQLVDQLPSSARVVAVCDCYEPQMDRMLAERRASWPRFTDYRSMIDQTQMDAVVVAVPDHNRTLPCVLACEAGLDIYAEKPLSVYVSEGRTLVRAVRKYGRICQVGTQQRSLPLNEYCCRFVREGGLGAVKFVQMVNYEGPIETPKLAPEPSPPGMSWDLWCGPTPLRPYHSKLHYDWRFFRDFSGGNTTNWGAHGFDQVQWALGKSFTGPRKIWPLQGGEGKVALKYDDGTSVRVELARGPLGGGVFVGEFGKMEINRNRFATNPPGLVTGAPAPAESKPGDPPNWITRPHLANWIDSIRTRKLPNADVEIGHRSVTCCHLVNLCRQLQRPLEWDPQTERFLNDAEANRLLQRPRRAGYKLPTA